MAALDPAALEREIVAQQNAAARAAQPPNQPGGGVAQLMPQVSEAAGKRRDKDCDRSGQVFMMETGLMEIWNETAEVQEIVSELSKGQTKKSLDDRGTVFLW